MTDKQIEEETKHINTRNQEYIAENNRMTDKQMKDEIDISKCEFCEDSEYCYIYSGTADFKWMCRENEDCQIKNLLLQLKRKEQECEELKKECEIWKNQVLTLNDEMITVQITLRQFEQYDNLKNCLAEIKDIAENVIKNVSDICIETTPMYCIHKQILQKINECGV